jgi:hypothetical protein
LSERSSIPLLLERLVTALNEHDLESLIACFHLDYLSEQPAHPARSFTGRDNVARNWAWVFDQFEDFQANLLDVSVRDTTIWTEWQWWGTDQSGIRVEVRGVMIFEVENSVFRSGRLYLEPVSNA